MPTKPARLRLCTTCYQNADAVIIALSLTSETRGVIGAPELALMKPSAWIVNVARGGHIDTDALVASLGVNAIGGAALDVTDPEPLPEGTAMDVTECPHYPPCRQHP